MVLTPDARIGLYVFELTVTLSKRGDVASVDRDLVSVVPAMVAKVDQPCVELLKTAQ